MDNIIRAVFCGSRYATTKSAWLIDHGMVLKLSGVELPEVYEVDFSNSKTSAAKRVLGNADGVVIPDEYFLSKAQQIYAWVYLTTGDSGYTVLQVTIPLSQRPDVSTEPPTPQETALIEQAIAALNDGVDRAETAADNAEQSAQDAADAVEHVQQTVNDALQEAKDSGEFDGTDGQDGVTYTPFVDTAGVISWTNDGDLPNPQPRNIRGPKGDPLTYADLTPADKEDLIQGPIAEAQTAAVAAVNQAGTVQVGNVNTAGAAQVQAVEDKGEDVLASIPSDYTELSEDVDEMKSVKAPVIIDTASGAIASFPDGANGVPVKSLTVDVEPVQEGSGDPSPDNVRPISGRTSVTIYHSDADTSDPTTYTIQLGDTVYGGKLDVTQGKMVVDRAYAVVGNSGWTYYAPYIYKVFTNKVIPIIGSVDTPLICSALPYDGVKYASAFSDVCIAQSSNSTVYIKDTACTSANDYYNKYSDATFVYYLATPIEITLTAQEIDTLLGTNNIWSDAGNVSVDYRADTKLYIDKKLAALVAALS